MGATRLLAPGNERPQFRAKSPARISNPAIKTVNKIKLVFGITNLSFFICIKRRITGKQAVAIKFGKNYPYWRIGRREKVKNNEKKIIAISARTVPLSIIFSAFKIFLISTLHRNTPINTRTIKILCKGVIRSLNLDLALIPGF
jgi:hypothetical protein